jgi:serine phosphatase RsbU (regulator of sigma subunit)
VHVPPGTVLVFFTDGLVERRTTDLQAGLERLRQAVSCAPAEQVSTTVLSRLVGPDPPGDDVTVLTLRRTE